MLRDTKFNNCFIHLKRPLFVLKFECCSAFSDFAFVSRAKRAWMMTYGIYPRIPRCYVITIGCDDLYAMALSESDIRTLYMYPSQVSLVNLIIRVQYLYLSRRYLCICLDHKEILRDIKIRNVRYDTLYIYLTSILRARLAYELIAIYYITGNYDIKLFLP